jgi:hypothetical protein
MVVNWIVILQILEKLLRLNLLLFHTLPTIAPSVCEGLATFQSSRVDQSWSQSPSHLLIWSLCFFVRYMHDCKTTSGENDASSTDQLWQLFL